MPSALIVTTLPVEYLTVRAHLTNPQEIVHPQGTIYEQGQFAANGQIWDICITETGTGNSGAALEIERAISFFNPDVILFVGIAGGIKDVSLGDVVISTKIYGYESGKTEETFKPLPEVRLGTFSLEQRARAEARKTDWLTRLSSVPSPTPKVFVAPITAGEKVVASAKSELFQFLRSNYGDAVAVEMEGFGFLEAARVSQRVSALVIRGISDLVDNTVEADGEEQKEIDSKTLADNREYQEIAVRHASAFSFAVLAKFSPREADLQTRESISKQPFQPGQLLQKRYQVVEILGSGGFGFTYLVQDKSLPGNPPCVMKQLALSDKNPQILEVARDLFRREAKTLGRIGNHPQLPRLLDYFENKQDLFLVQEFVNGKTLQQEVKQVGPFSEAGVRQFLCEILPLIQYVHRSEIIHRDIKPSTIIRRDEDKKLILIDFGAIEDIVNLATENSEQTKSEAYSISIGTQGYAPPEQMAGRPVYASDIYSIGITCIYLLTGKSPANLDYDPNTGEVLWRDHVDVSDSWSQILERMLKVSVRERYSSAAEILQDLEKVGQSEDLRLIENISQSSIFDKRRHALLQERLHSLNSELEALRRDHAIATNASEIRILRQSIEEKESEVYLIEQEIDRLDTVSISRRKKVSLGSQHAYSVLVNSPSIPVTIGSEFDISIMLEPSDSMTDRDCLLEIPQGNSSASEINVLLIASGCCCNGSNAASLPLVHNVDSTLLNGQLSQTASFSLVASHPGLNTIRAEIFYGNELQKVLTCDIQVSQVDAFATNQLISARSRPVPQPDLILQVQTGWNESLSRCTFNYHLDSFHPRLAFASEIQQQSETFSAEWLGQTRRFLQNTLEDFGSSLPEDYRSQLTSLGKHLFQQLLPQELQATFRSIMRFNVPFTILILADQDAEFPWELLHDGQSFLGERFITGRWPLEMEKTRPYEFAIGAVSLAHYENVEQPEQWSGLLEPSGAPPPMMLSDGVLADLGSVEVMRGLHLLRRGTSPEEIERQDAPVPLESNGSEDLEQSLRPAKLSLRRNRPLVTLGYLNAGVPELTTLEYTWAPTFIRSGCSTFIGPLWAVQPAVETAFTSSFYHRLWAGESLGMAFQAGRRAAKAVAPDLLDWMAYVLYGDPMARPYRPTVGKGYAVVEPIGQEITDRVAPGSSVRFRVSLRRTPPVWYSDRLMDVSEYLTFEDLRVYIMASGLQVTPGDSIDMQRSPSGDYLGWFTLTVPSNFERDSALVRVHYEDGDDPVHSLRFVLSVGDEEMERP